MGFGETISYSLLTSRIQAYSPYVKDVRVKTPNKDIKVGNIQFPKLGNVVVNLVDEL